MPACTCTRETTSHEILETIDSTANWSRPCHDEISVVCVSSGVDTTPCSRHFTVRPGYKPEGLGSYDNESK